MLVLVCSVLCVLSCVCVVCVCVCVFVRPSSSFRRSGRSVLLSWSAAVSIPVRVLVLMGCGSNFLGPNSDPTLWDPGMFCPVF